MTHGALVGDRKQSVKDAERLLSFKVAIFLQANGWDIEAKYVNTIAEWHEASDGRGLDQRERCKRNYKMLNYILDDWFPYYRDGYDFSYIDINR